MTHVPLLSFIVLSYNYEKYIGQTIRSILEQTVQDFEIVIVDDASSDRSREVINAFDDSRIRLLVNEKNLGGAGSYNRAVEAARGEWLVNLDADDWIVPEKSQRQLDAIENDPELDIVGTYCRVVDANGNQHPDHERLEPYFVQKHDLNVLDNWIGDNLLCRSSTMIRREAHLRIGLDDPTMIRAPDYELWTRALRHGCRFRIVPEQLTYYRLHARGVTFGDPRGTYLELSYAMLKNFIPLAEDRAKWNSFSLILTWLTEQEQFAVLAPTERYNLLGSMVMCANPINYETFVKDLGKHGSATDLGRRILALIRNNPLLERVTAWQAESKRSQSPLRLRHGVGQLKGRLKKMRAHLRLRHRVGQLKGQLKKMRSYLGALRTKWKPLR
jgi:glycosyltransferase involved in cell wall biosynthesis